MTTSSVTTGLSTSSLPARSDGRINWVDTAKGICIILVVMMHTTLGLEAASGQQGWMHSVVAFSKPFRMPDFFVISGLFLAATIDRPWRHYLDRKVVHFFYFYILWVIIQFAFKAPFMIKDGASLDAVMRTYAFTFVQPFGTLWFIYMLPVFFVVTKLANRHKWTLFAVAIALQIAPINTSSLYSGAETALGVIGTDGYFVLIDEFASFFVYFLAGYLFAPKVFALANWVQENALSAVAILGVWFAINLTVVWLSVDGWPIISLILGAMGAVAIITFASLVARFSLIAPLTHAGANSIVIYLAFFLPMVIMRLFMLKFTPWIDPGTMALIGLAVAVVTPLIGYWAIRKIGIGYFLFERPNWAVLKGTPWKRPGSTKAVLHPAE